jgi:hypothetical protein
MIRAVCSGVPGRVHRITRIGCQFDRRMLSETRGIRKIRPATTNGICKKLRSRHLQRIIEFLQINIFPFHSGVSREMILVVSRASTRRSRQISVRGPIEPDQDSQVQVMTADSCRDLDRRLDQAGQSRQTQPGRISLEAQDPVDFSGPHSRT